MILEGLVTTLSAAGELNIAPMGPIVDRSMTWLKLRPFRTSRTFQNLREQPFGVLHVTDDVGLMARAALNGLQEHPETQPAVCIPGRILTSACRWYEFEITRIDDSTERAELDARVVHAGHLREMFGFNRAMYAVLEITILATRLHLLPEPQVRAEILRLAPLIEKTASVVEEQAWQYVLSEIDHWYLQRNADG